MFNVNDVRNDFPMIKNHPDLIYFDNGATTYKPQVVIDAITKFYTDYTSNVERGDYETAIQADRAYEEARKCVATLIHSEEKEVVFLSNITAALNQIAYGLSKKLNKGDVILTSKSEHASNLLPWYRLKDDLGVEIKYVNVDDVGRIDIDDFKNQCDENVKVVTFASVTNVLGTNQPVKELTKIAHDNGAIVVIDAAQAIGHQPIDVKDLDIDFLCFSSHKMCGPDGVGVLYGKYNLLDEMDPLLLGGGMNARFTCDGKVVLKDAPHKFEAGTPNIEGVIGLSAACKYLMALGLDNIHAYEKELREYMKEKFKELDNVIVYNLENESGPITFNVKDVFAQDAAGYLAANHIAVRSGNHCAKILHEIIGTDQSVRASLYFYNTKEEVDYFIEKVKEINLESAIGIFF